MTVKEIVDAMNEFENKALSEQEKHMREMFEECGYSYEEVVSMMKRGEMVGRATINGYGFT